MNFLQTPLNIGAVVLTQVNLEYSRNRLNRFHEKRYKCIGRRLLDNFPVSGYLVPCQQQNSSIIKYTVNDVTGT